MLGVTVCDCDRIAHLPNCFCEHYRKCGLSCPTLRLNYGNYSSHTKRIDSGRIYLGSDMRMCVYNAIRMGFVKRGTELRITLYSCIDIHIYASRNLKLSPPRGILRLRARVKAVWFWVSAARFPRRIVGRKENKKPRLPHPRRWLLPSASNDEKHWGVSFY